MNNQGKITVFMTLVMLVMVSLIIAVINICEHYVIWENANVATRGAISDVKSSYDSYIFEHYHILLFDKTMYGKGEGAYEEMMKDYVNKNLGGKAECLDVVNSYTDLVEDDCKALKSQINEIMPYLVAEYGADKVLEKTGGEDGSLSSLDQEQMSKSELDAQNIENGESDDVNLEVFGFGKKKDDPREKTKLCKYSGVLYVVKPEKFRVSEKEIDLSNSFSKTYVGTCEYDVIGGFESDFDDYGSFKNSTLLNGCWNGALANAGLSTTYYLNVFNDAVSKKVNTSAVLDYELEYLIEGYSSDAKNLSEVTEKIVGMRTMLNYGYLIKDVEKMAEIRSLATTLSVIVLVPEPILKYLLTGCWAYAESIYDTRMLLEGKKVPYKKTSKDWHTSLMGIGTDMMQTGNGSSKGLDYKDYLTILLATKGDIATYRALDLMETNARTVHPEFKITNAAVGLDTEVKIRINGAISYIHMSGGY